MRILVYEHLLATCAANPDSSLLTEGRAMMRHVLAALQLVPEVDAIACCGSGVEVDLLANSVVVKGTPIEFLECQAPRFDGVLVIAPETDSVLANLLAAVQRGGGRFFSPGPEFVGTFADKLATARLLGELAVPTEVWHTSRMNHERLVVKPRDGAGAQFTAVVGNGTSTKEFVDRSFAAGFAGEFVVQPYWGADSASIATGTAGSVVVLPPVMQGFERLAANAAAETLSYVGGEFVLDRAIEERIGRVAETFVQRVPQWLGYLGIDVVLDQFGIDDRIVDVNPRITTSIVGYQRLFGGLLGRLILGQLPRNDGLAEYRHLLLPEAVRHRGRLGFSADGRMDSFQLDGPDRFDV